MVEIVGLLLCMLQMRVEVEIGIQALPALPRSEWKSLPKTWQLRTRFNSPPSPSRQSQWQLVPRERS